LEYDAVFFFLLSYSQVVFLAHIFAFTIFFLALNHLSGVLEANFIKPTHDKQDFEKSSIYQKLENRLKEMTYEYWYAITFVRVKL